MSQARRSYRFCYSNEKAASEEQVAAVKEAVANAEDIKLTDKAQIIDISLSNKDGSVVKLSNGTLKISLKKNADIDYTKYAVVVYHLKDDNTLEKLDVTVSDDAISFVTGGLSPFVIDYVEVESASGADTTITEDATVTAPTTGDAAPVAIYLLLAVMAIMMACTVAGKKRIR